VYPVSTAQGRRRQPGKGAGGWWKPAEVLLGWDWTLYIQCPLSHCAGHEEGGGGGGVRGGGLGRGLPQEGSAEGPCMAIWGLAKAHVRRMLHRQPAAGRTCIAQHCGSQLRLCVTSCVRGVFIMWCVYCWHTATAPCLTPCV
jgi:hypothetical protein